MPASTLGSSKTFQPFQGAWLTQLLSNNVHQSFSHPGPNVHHLSLGLKLEPSVLTSPSNSAYNSSALSSHEIKIAVSISLSPSSVYSHRPSGFSGAAGWNRLTQENKKFLVGGI
ncbi:hypothetical protein MRB53_000279 [Persea americana]|uniref:Uncharacterized protein n=1 Tax=Persea americana TaxID=3435 RepID=A0ACC2MPA7_PERAE|nr:hypothetical protein MRB53_000279 [Persea americana]